MTPPAIPPLAVERLVAYLGEGVAPGTDSAGSPGDLAAWLTASPRFRAFVETHRDKIRKKLRGAATPDAALDVRAELWVAAQLLRDRRLELAFEAYGSGRRGPDFTATFRAGRPFNVEVTRRRGTGDATLEPAILGKLRQLPPSASNVIVVVLSGSQPPDPGPVVRELRARADRRDDGFFRSAGLDGAAAFHAGLLRLAAVAAVTTVMGTADESAAVAHWRNAGARIPLPEPALRAVVAAIGGGTEAAGATARGRR